MTTIDNIPVRLIQRIIVFHIGYRATDLYHWKQRLSVIGVCRLWRNIGISLVYNQVFFVDYSLYISTDESLRERRGRYLRHRGLPSKRPILVSNIELLVMLDRCYLARDIVINVNGDMPQHLFVDELCRMLELGHGNWISVVNIRIYENWIHEIKAIETGASDIRDKQYDLTRIVGFAKRNFLAVTRIACSASDTLIGRFGMQLNRIFMDHVSGLCLNMSLLDNQLCLSQRIGLLDLVFDETERIIRLPIVLAESLKSLVLRDLPLGFDWTCFQNTVPPYSTDITFANLGRLNVSYRTTSYGGCRRPVCERPEPVDQLGIKLHFPKLSELIVRNCCRNSSLLHAVFSKRVDFLLYSGTLSSIALCSQINVKPRTLSICIASADEHEEQLFYETTNKLIVDGENTRNQLSLESIYFPINVELLKCDFLHHIAIDCPIGFRTFVGLLLRLPSLECLIINPDCIGSLCDSVGVEFLDMCQQMAGFVLSLNLKYVYLSFQVDPYRYKQVLGLTVFLMSYCPNLCYVEADYILKDDLETYLRRCDKVFCHFKKLRYGLKVFPGFAEN